MHNECIYTFVDILCFFLMTQLSKNKHTSWRVARYFWYGCWVYEISKEQKSEEYKLNTTYLKNWLEQHPFDDNKQGNMQPECFVFN